MIYNKRWSIEEYFKLIKKTTNINKNNEILIDNIKKSFIFYNIVSKLTYLIKIIMKNKQKVPKIKL